MSVDWRSLDTDVKLALRERLQSELDELIPPTWYCTLPACDGMPHAGMPMRHARSSQRPPDGDWLLWLILAGRGYGKTMTGAKWVHERAIELHPRGALIAPTSADARDVMIEGETGVLATAPRDKRPRYEPSKRRLTWPNGAQAAVYSADEPERLRGPQHGWAWGDEPAAWVRLDAAWSNLLLGLRLGQHPRVLLTTTPKPLRLLRDLLAAQSTHVTSGSTYENLHNLAPTFREQVLARYEGTRLGRQELYAEMLLDVEGSLWTQAMIDNYRIAVDDLPLLHRIVVAVDPAVTSGEDSDETGIVVAGVTAGKEPHVYVLDDLTCRESPQEWVNIARRAYVDYQADRIVAEANNGGDMVEAILRSQANGQGIAYKKVTASRGKRVRAEPVSALYEQGRVHHVGMFAQLEDQMTSWVPLMNDGSPDRMDALVWAITELAVEPQRKKGAWSY